MSTFVSFLQASLKGGARTLLDSVSFKILEGDRIGVIGRNGVGKSSLLKIIAGLDVLDDGSCQIQKGLSIVYVEQETSLPESSTLLDSLQAKGKICQLQDEREKWQVKAKLSTYLHKFGLLETKNPAELSGGEKKKAALALALALEPQLLLLDEPTNHLDICARQILEQILLEEFKKSRSLVCITHDRAFLDAVASKILELDRGQLKEYPGNFESYQSIKLKETEAESKAFAEFDKTLAAEETWIRKGIEARRTRNEGRVRRLEKMRELRKARQEQLGKAKLTLAEGLKSGRLVAELENVSKSFGQRKIIKNLNLRLLRGDRLGLIGPNGAGKTTLIKLLLGGIEPDWGSVKLGTNIQLAYFDQLRAELDPQKTLSDTVSPGSEWVESGGQKKHILSYLGEFLFPPRYAQMKVSSLSGGERNRLLLAKLFAKPVNFLILDEPTNDLDIPSLEVLEKVLGEYRGTVILVTHDRYFMDAVATVALAPDEQGNWVSYVGGTEEWLQTRMTKKEASQPAKSKNNHKQLRVRTKLSFKEQKLLDSLPSEIEKLEQRQQYLVALMQTADYYTSYSPEQRRTDGEEIKRIEEKLTENYAKWEELELLKDSFG